MNLTENFTRAEMLVSATAARKGISNEPASPEIEANLLRSAQYMQQLRDKLGKPIHILSCYRSPAVNKAVGGAKTSAHMKALAIDFTVQGQSNRHTAEWVRDNFDYRQLILEFPDSASGGWVHVEIPGRAGNPEILLATKIGGRTVYKTGFA